MLIHTPKSTATTVLGLLDDVKAAVLAEPKRANMTHYVDESTIYSVADGPSCGTTGCFAGWSLMLAGLSLRKLRASGAYQELAEQLLGKDLTYVFGRTKRWGFFNAGAGDACSTTAKGTKAHAKALAARIDRFIRLNGGRKALANKPLNADLIARYR